MPIISNLEKAEQFNYSERIISQYILKKKDLILEMSIHELALNTHSSTSTIVRLCRKIGLKGYKDFKIKFSAELQKHYDGISNVNYDFPFTESDSYIEIAGKIYELSNESMNLTKQLMNSITIEKAVRAILNARRTGIFAEGDSYIRALSFQNRLMKINVNLISTSIHGENDQLANTFTKEDCAIIISYSGETKAPTRTAKILRKNHVKIIAITSNPSSHIASLSDIIVPLVKKESQSIRFSTFSSQVAIEYVLNVLYSCLFAANYSKNQKLRIDTETMFLDTRF